MKRYPSEFMVPMIGSIANKRDFEYMIVRSITDAIQNGDQQASEMIVGFLPQGNSTLCSYSDAELPRAIQNHYNPSQIEKAAEGWIKEKILIETVGNSFSCRLAEESFPDSVKKLMRELNGTAVVQGY